MSLIVKILEESKLLRKTACCFQDTLKPICGCGFDVESTSHYILH